MNRLIALFALACMLGSALAQTPKVFVDAYNNDLFGKNIIPTGNRDLLIGGDKLYRLHTQAHPNKSDFGLMRVDTDGSPLLTKTYHFLNSDHLKYVRNARNGYVFGGNSQKKPGQHRRSVVVIARTNLRGVVGWSKAFYPSNGRGIVISGLAVNDSGEVVFAAHIYRDTLSSTGNSRAIHGMVVKLDAWGNVLWTRRVRLGNRFGLKDVPNSNVAFNAEGDILTGWHFGRRRTPNAPDSVGIAFRSYAPNGRLKWNRAYRANRLLSMTYTPADSGLAAYALDTLNRSGLIKLDSTGMVKYAFIDNLRPTANAAFDRRGARIKTDRNRIPYSYLNRLTLHKRDSSHLSATALSMPNITVEPRASLSDFVVKNRHAYIVGSVYYPPTRRSYPVLLKSIYAKADNCFTRLGKTGIRKRFPLPPFRINLTPSVQSLISINDSVISLRVRSLNTLDSVACVGDGKVWPGDANSDGIAEVKDIFAIGLAWHARGPKRPNASIRWIGQPARNWGRDFFNGANFKHADCNGSGRVGVRDILAILRNYGRTHNKTITNGVEGDLPLSLSLPADGIEAGTKAQIPVYLGSSQYQSTDIHGIAFSVFFDPGIVGEDVVFIPVNSWLGTPEVDLQWIQKSFHEEGSIEIGLTRTDGTDAIGSGKIGYLSFTPKNDLNEAQPFFIDLGNTAAINSREQEFELYGQGDNTVVLAPETSGSTGSSPATNLEIQESLRAGIRTFPVPAAEELNFWSESVKIESVELVGLYGKRLISEAIDAHEGSLRVGHLPAGIYVLKMVTEEGNLSKKISIK